jgi:hypothetical protein
MPASYAWIITKDTLPQVDGIPSIVGTYGPRDCPLARDLIAGHAKGKKFRLLDDDCEIMAEGVLVDLRGRCSGFEPKDDYGEGALGATTIQYWEKGWKDL